MHQAALAASSGLNSYLRPLLTEGKLTPWAWQTIHAIPSFRTQTKRLWWSETAWRSLTYERG
jgi:hypothetical protein